MRETADLASRLPIPGLGIPGFVFVKISCMENAMGLEYEEQDSISSLYSYQLCE